MSIFGDFYSKPFNMYWFAYF